MTQNTYPTVLEGTVFRPKSGTGKSGKPFIGFALSVYAGKDQDGNYRKGPFVDVTVVGNGVAFGVPAEKARVRVSGFLEEREFKRRDGTPGTGLALTALEITAVELPQGAGSGAAAPARAQPAPKPRQAPAPAAAPGGFDEGFDDDIPF